LQTHQLQTGKVGSFIITGISLFSLSQRLCMGIHLPPTVMYIYAKIKIQICCTSRDIYFDEKVLLIIAHQSTINFQSNS